MKPMCVYVFHEPAAQEKSVLKKKKKKKKPFLRG